MNGRYLLDSNIIIALFANDSQIHSHIIASGEIFIPCIAIGELYFGAYKSQNMQKNIDRIDEFALNNTVLACDTATAKIYGDLKNYLKGKGQAIPENDIWIAAIAQQYDLTLITKDSYFDRIEKVSVELW